MKGYRTLALNFLTVAASGVTIVSDTLGGLDLKEYVDGKVALYILVGLALVNALLRFATTSPVGRKE